MCCSRLPRKPELKALVLKGRDFYNNNRDPWHYNPTKESGWDNRAAIIKQPITAGPLAIGASAFKFEKQGAGTGAGAAHGSSALLQQFQQSQQQQLPSVEEAKEQFSTFPVLLQPNSARPDSKLLLPFLSHWPPPFRFDYLRKHSRAPLSPFLASVHGYDVPPEMFLSARQLKEMQRAQMEQMGYDAEYSQQQQQQQQWGFDPSQQQGQGQQQQHSNDPVERARARANTHTTYWRTVPPEGIDPATARDVAHGHGQHGGGGPPPPKSHRPEWNFRHHVKPPEPRVGQTTAKKPTGRSARHRAQLQQQQQMQQQQQQQQAMMHAQLMSGQHLPPLMYGPGADGQMQQQMMMMPPYGQFPPFPPMADIDPAVLAHFQQMQLQQQQQDWQQQQQWMMQQQEQDQQQQQHGDEEKHSEQQQADQQRFDEQQQQQQRYEQQQHDQQQQQQQEHSREQHESTEQHEQPQATSDPAKHGASHPPPSDGAAAPTLNPHAQSHVKDVYNQLYHANDAASTTTDQAAPAAAAADQ